ncbi:dTMP kinase [Candidatus Pacearchaeota archaeon]|nr:dTMP kinase [Candidatus Pacearchaeota archaeon]|tara:strand:- start:2453 stop:3076 length:624 start_codon:yes stop_codon:yes gene_type:complete
MFIVLDGIDGCGKSTQVWKLAKWLSGLDKYNHVVVTREPYKYREIREILRLEENPEERMERLIELFVKDRQEHIDEIIKPALEREVIVISDRYKYSTICYQAAQGRDMGELIERQKQMPIPDFIFLVDISVETAGERRRKESKDGGRVSEHKFEKSRKFLAKVRENYLKLKGLLPEENIIIIDGEKGIEEIFEEVKKGFEKGSGMPV